MPLQAITSTEPIAGYRIRERIGAGGYGEVWTADAPGGLIKAIKFVYGFLNEDRAARELKALNRIKSVRHPFLLSLERIEIVDGQLLIVTELAEASLKERFEACRSNGLRGIPRDELMRYMRDAADVLDYMNEEHSLQHLDIKPENLLMLAGRVKVADFGLVKDIHDATASLMGGLTPLYAPPEVFDGRPSRRSDQYSLAIVFQEMLTGELPFPGNTAMQLARQHMHARPRLSALPEQDQEVIARALAKSPEDRYANCRELVDALELSDKAQSAHAGDSRQAARRREGATNSIPRDPSVRKVYPTEAYGDESVDGGASARLRESSVPRVSVSPPVRTLPPIELADVPHVARPTLFLGVGRSAGRILLQLRRRLEDRFGTSTGIPALQTLLLDTDPKDLLSVTHHRHGLQSSEVLSLPLRPPQDYRQDSRELLRWLSRRWLYNIPKSLRTEGLRPLGRLALVDHADEVAERLRAAISTATSDESRVQSRNATGFEFAPHRMRIVVIASICGGTGSGTVADLGYLARHLLAETDLPDDDVLAVLTHSTGRTARESELALVNAYSTLCELNHYGRLGGHYPGEAGFRLPPRREDNTAFRDMYLIDLGDGLNEQQFDDAADQVATYLYLDVATSGGEFFQACRDSQPRRAETRNTDLPLRTFGVHQFSCLQDDILAITVEHLCRHAVERWLAGTSVELQRPALKTTTSTVSQSGVRTDAADYSHLTVVAERFAESFRLDTDSLVQEVFRLVEHQLGGSVASLLQDLIARSTSGTSAEAGSDASRIPHFIAEIDALLGARQPPPDAARSEPGTLAVKMAPLLQRSALKRADAIREWLLDMVDDETCRVRGAQWLAQWLAALCRANEDRTNALQGAAEEALQESEQHLATLATGRARSRGRSASEAMPAALEQYARQRLHSYVLASVDRVLRAAKGQVSSVRDELVDFERELRHLGDHFDTLRTLDSLIGDETSVADDLLESVGQALLDHREDLTQHLQQHMQSEVLKEAGGLRRLLAQGGDQQNQLPAVLRSLARTSIVAIMRSLNVADILFHDSQQGDDVTKFAESLTAAQPRLMRCGGARRLLVMLPRESAAARPLHILREQLGESPSMSHSSDGDFVLCHEVEQISLTQAAVTLVDGRCDLIEFADRLHTRSDIAWSPLPDVE